MECAIVARRAATQPSSRRVARCSPIAGQVYNVAMETEPTRGCPTHGKVVYRYEPLASPLVRRRFAAVKDLLARKPS